MHGLAVFVHSCEYSSWEFISQLSLFACGTGTNDDKPRRKGEMGKGIDLTLYIAHLSRHGRMGPLKEKKNSTKNSSITKPLMEEWRRHQKPSRLRISRASVTCHPAFWDGSENDAVESQGQSFVIRCTRENAP
jgi:hypothetical protein